MGLPSHIDYIIGRRKEHLQQQQHLREPSSSKYKDIALNFVGTVWTGNKKALYQFTVGCSKAHVVLWTSEASIRERLPEKYLRRLNRTNRLFIENPVDSERYAEMLAGPFHFMPAL